MAESRLQETAEHTGTEGEDPPATPVPSAPAPNPAPNDTLVDAHVEGPPSAWLGRVIDDRYRIVEPLAEGGMGAVFVAEHIKLHKVVAFKTIHPSFLGDEEVAARFAREARASAQLQHPHVATALDYGSLPEGGAYLVLEFVSGPSLRAQIEERGALPWNEVCDIGAQVADALAAAHAVGIVHRDLKPDNVLLEARHDGPPIVKVLDFGIAAIHDGAANAAPAPAPARGLTRVGAVLGTPGYMAPEQAMGDAVDGRADLYALGVLLWELLAGRSLFDAPNLTGILTQQYGASASARLAQVTVSVPAELATLLDRLLAPLPKDRIARAVEVRELLRAFSSRDAAQEAGLVRIALPSALRQAAPKLRTAFRTVHAAVSPRLLGLLKGVGPRVRSLWAGAPRWLRAWVRQAADFLGGLPRKVVWASSVAALVLVGSLVMVQALRASDPSAPPKAPAPLSAASQKGQTQVAAQADPAEVATVQSQLDALSRSRSSKARRAAARWLQKPPAGTEVPAVAKALARLELGPSCQARTKALRRLRALRDPQALPAVRYWSNKPRRGCGALKKRDCYACLRAALQATQHALRKEATAHSAAR